MFFDWNGRERRLLDLVDTVMAYMRGATTNVELVAKRLDNIEYLLLTINRRLSRMANTLDDVQAQVALDKEIDSSAVKLIEGLVAKLAAAQGDPAQIAQILADMKANSAALAAAVTANTPAAPAQQGAGDAGGTTQ